MVTKAASNRSRCANRSPSLPLGPSSTRKTLNTEPVDVEDQTTSHIERNVDARDPVAGNPGQRSIGGHQTGLIEGPPPQCQYASFETNCQLSPSPTTLASQPYQYPHPATAIATCMDSDSRYYDHRSYGSTLSRVKFDADSKRHLKSIVSCNDYAGVPEPLGSPGNPMGCSGYGLGTGDKPSSDFVSRGLASYHASLPGYHGSVHGYHSYIPGYQGPHSFMNIGLSTHFSSGF